MLGEDDDYDDYDDFMDVFFSGPEPEPLGPPPETEDLDFLSFLKEELPLPGPPPPNDKALMPEILIRSLNGVKTAGWHYNPRSDRHSIIKCLGTLLDLVRSSPLLESQLLERKVVFGINSKVGNKYLDLVIGLPEVWAGSQLPRSFGEWSNQVDLQWDPSELSCLDKIGDLQEGTIGLPLLAIEAKAVMTDHAGALPRVSDELERFRFRVQDQAINAALVMVNTAEDFISPGRNGYDPTRFPLNVSTHKQPSDAEKVLGMLSKLPLREDKSAGFDSIGVVCLDCPNNGQPSTLCDLAPQELSYPYLVERLSGRYEQRFSSL